MVDKVETRTFTIEELAPTQEEAMRNYARMAIDMQHMEELGVPPQARDSIGKLRYDWNATYTVMPMQVDDILTTCVILEVFPGKTVVFALLNGEHTLAMADGTSIANMRVELKNDPKKMN